MVTRSIANALELLQSCTKTSKWRRSRTHTRYACTSFWIGQQGRIPLHHLAIHFSCWTMLDAGRSTWGSLSCASEFKIIHVHYAVINFDIFDLSILKIQPSIMLRIPNSICDDYIIYSIYVMRDEIACKQSTFSMVNVPPGMATSTVVWWSLPATCWRSSKWTMRLTFFKQSNKSAFHDQNSWYHWYLFISSY